jgi:hypothetical protein
MALTNDVIGMDPQLIDPENGDYRVTPGTPAEGYGCQIFPVSSVSQTIESKKIKNIPLNFSRNRSYIEVSGLIDTDTIWDADTVKVVGNIEIADGVTLQIAPNTKVEFQDFYGINVNGCLEAIGTPEENILFTSQNPDLFLPDYSTEGAWNGIRFHHVNSENDRSIFAYCAFQYSKVFTDTLKGAAISVYDYSKLDIINCRFYNNVADYGGAISLEYHSNPNIIGNVFSDNIAFLGGSPIYCSYSFPRIMNNTVYRNSVLNEESYYLTGAVQTFISKPKIMNNIIYGNENNFHEPIQLAECKDFYTTYNDIEFGHGGTGNIYEIPFFIDTGGHPLALTEISACIDGGNPNLSGWELPETDLCGNIRVWDGDGNGSEIIDMGAYEFGAPQVNIENYILNIEDCRITNYPNPFNPSTTISFNLKNTSLPSQIEIYNLKGQKLKVLECCNFFAANTRDSFSYTITWDGTDSSDKPVASGVYFSVLRQSDKILASKKMLLLK